MTKISPRKRVYSKPVEGWQFDIVRRDIFNTQKALDLYEANGDLDIFNLSLISGLCFDDLDYKLRVSRFKEVTDRSSVARCLRKHIESLESILER